MEPTTRTKRYWLVRVFSPDMGEDLYPYDSRRGYGNRAAWYLTDSLNSAGQFSSYSTARQVARCVAVQDKVREDGWFWEVAEVTETVVTTSVVDIVAGDAPAMLQLARACV